MVRTGESYEHEGIKVRIVEVATVTLYKGRRTYLIGYKIIDGDYTSPTAHFHMAEYEDIRRWVERIVDHYLDIKRSMALP